MKPIFWTDTAIQSLHATSDFILKTWGTKINNDFLELLELRISQLQKNTELAPPFANKRFRKLIIHKTQTNF